MKRSIILILLIFQFLHLFGQTCSTDSLIVRSIKAFETDSNINWELQKHQVFINPDCVQNDKLVLHLVGSFDNPANTTYFPSMAANNGYKSINLKYPNSTAALSACGNSNDVDCFQGFREEIIFGVDSNSSVEVDMNNCIINRLEKLLNYLHNNYPLENWGIFLTENRDINWSNIIVSGHSQGGGHAAFIGKKFDVNRVLMFASPTDYSNVFSTPANWISSPSMTPDSNYYAFGNLFDDVVDFNKLFENWSAMNLLSQADSTNVDNSNGSYNNSNILYTRHDTSTGFSNSHNNMIIDNFTPISAGTPVFLPVWKYMLGIQEVSTSVSKANDFINNIKLFPNPTSSMLLIESNEMISKIEIYTLSGSLLKTIKPFKKNIEVNVESFKGVLLLYMTLQNNDGLICETIIVK
jgi:hypothetical protein